MIDAVSTLLLIVLGVAELLLLASTSTKSSTPGGDFAILYSGAKLANENPLALYDSQMQFRIEQQALHSEGYEARFFYPPFFALAIRPLGKSTMRQRIGHGTH